jgi:hypothetical protein
MPKVWKLPSGEYLKNEEGEVVSSEDPCCCEDVEPDCDPRYVVVEEGNCSTGLACLCNAKFAVVDLTFAGCWDRLNGSYPLSRSGSGCVFGEIDGAFVRHWNSAYPGDPVDDGGDGVCGTTIYCGADGDTPIFASPLDFTFGVTLGCSPEGQLCVYFGTVTTNTDCENAFRDWGGSECFDPPIYNAGETSYGLTPINPDDILPSIPLPTITSVNVQLFGAYCDEDGDPCLDPPIAGATYERVSYFEDDEFLLACGGADPELLALLLQNSCRIKVTDTSKAGSSGCPVERVWLITDNGTYEFPEPGGTLTINLSDSCGPYSGELKIVALDSRGCHDEYELLVSCCGCCPPEGGGFSDFTTDENVDGVSPGSSCDEPSGVPSSNENCFLHDHRLCYYKITFAELAVVGACSAGGFYHVDWDGLEARGGGSPPTCVFPGDIIRVRVDEGMLGPCHCIKVTAVNYEGCIGDSIYFELNGPMCVSTIEYNGADPEDDCYDNLIISDCPPLETP